MLAVATAGAPTASVNALGKCERTQGDTVPMLFALPRLSPLTSLYADVYATGAAPPPPLPLLPPAAGDGGPSSAALEIGSLWWRVSGAHGQFQMIGLGDIVLPAFAIAFARRIDLATAPERAAVPSCGYYAWAVCGYGAGLAVTLAANVYGWTINGVEGQPALLYLVCSVLDKFRPSR